MSQQVTVDIIVDIQAAIRENSLENNIYLIDNLRDYGSEGEGTNRLVTNIEGGYWCDYSQSYDVVLNWMCVSLGSLPSTLPRNYLKSRSEQLFAQLKHESDKIENADGKVYNLNIKTLNLFGQPLTADEYEEDSLSYLYPQISDITGEAVDEGVIFPAQYGTPISIKDGWYWSATVDTAKKGIYKYTLHITLFKRKKNMWIPVQLTHDAWIKVNNAPQRNGFTEAGMGILPIV